MSLLIYWVKVIFSELPLPTALLSGAFSCCI
jgi:hypothetical protein